MGVQHYRGDVKMSVYVDYVILKTAYNESLRNLKDALDKQEEAFTRTLPSAIRYDLQKVLHSPSTTSPLDDYVMDNEYLEQKIRQARVILIQRKEMLELKAQELKQSKNIDDRIFWLKYVELLTVESIAIRMNYSEGNIYYHLGKIKHELRKNKLL